MNTRHDDDFRDLEADLRSALQAEAQSIIPGERLAAIQHQVRMQSAPARPRTRWLALVAAAAAVALVATMAALSLFPGLRTPNDPAASGPTISSTPATDPFGSPVPSETSASGSAALPVYYLTMGGLPSGGARWLLARTFVRPQAGSATDPQTRIRAALQWCLSPAAWPHDDLAPAFTDVRVTAMSAAPDVLTVTLSGPGRDLSGSGDANLAEMAVQQLVWTAQAAYGQRVPVSFRVADGSRLLLGRLPTTARYDRPDTSAIFSQAAPVWIDSPGIGQVLPAGTPTRASGLAAVGTTVAWHLENLSGGAVIASSSATLGDLVAPSGQRGYAFDLPLLTPGSYALRVSTMPEGTAGTDGSGAVVAVATFTVE